MDGRRHLLKQCWLSLFTGVAVAQTSISSPNTTSDAEESFVCQDGCVVDSSYINDRHCDCSACEDEADWTCDTCAGGCPESCGLTCCGDYTGCESASSDETYPPDGYPLYPSPSPSPSQTYPTTTKSTTGEESFVCQDGCVVDSSYINDRHCDCSACEDEADWTCNTCAGGCPKSCGDYTGCEAASSNETYPPDGYPLYPSPSPSPSQTYPTTTKPAAGNYSTSVLNAHLLSQTGNLLLKFINKSEQVEQEHGGFEHLEVLTTSADTGLAVTTLVAFNPQLLDQSSPEYLQVSKEDFEIQMFSRRIAIPRSIAQHPAIISAASEDFGALPPLLVSTFIGATAPKPGQVCVLAAQPEQSNSSDSMFEHGVDAMSTFLGTPKPQAKTGSKALQLSHALDISFLGVSEADGNAFWLPMENFQQPIIFQLMEEVPEAMTPRCAYLNGSVWSTDGVRSATQEELNRIFGSSRSSTPKGFWCATYHLSIFAAIVDLDAIGTEDNALEAWAGILIGVVVCSLCCIACCCYWTCKVYRKPKAGALELNDDRGGQHQFTFKISEIQRSKSIVSQKTEKSGQGSTASGADAEASPTMSEAKTRVTWEVDVDKVQEAQFKFSKKRQTWKRSWAVTHLTDFGKSWSKEGLAVEDDNNPEQEVVDKMKTTTTDNFLDGIMPEDLNAEVAIDVKKEEIKYQAYKPGNWVEYYSTTHSQWLQGQIKEAGRFTDEMPSYTVMLKWRFSFQQRDFVKMDQLRPPFKEGDAVSFLSGSNNWQNGIVQSHSWTFGYKIQPVAQDDEALTQESVETLVKAAASQVRPRFPVESRVSVYRDAIKGWVSGRVKESDDFHVDVEMEDEIVKVALCQVCLQKRWQKMSRGPSVQSL